MEAVITKKVRGGEAFYTINWSKLAKADKYLIITKVPSVTGIFELYYRDHSKVLNRFYFAKAWYGGLRNSIRETTDPELEQDRKRRAILEEYDCYFRYSVTQSFGDMTDLLYYFSCLLNIPNPQIQPTPRYTEIFVKEVSDDKIIDI